MVLLTESNRFFPTEPMCSEEEFLCSSGMCLNRSKVCDGKKDCSAGDDEGSHCGDVCTNATCSQNCRVTPTGPECYCDDGYSWIATTKLARSSWGHGNGLVAYALRVQDPVPLKTLEQGYSTFFWWAAYMSAISRGLHTYIDECSIEGFCSQECTNIIGSYKCSCLEGYDSVNRTCEASGSEPLLIFSNLKEIRAFYLRSKRYFLIQKAVYRAASVDADPLESKIYWIEISNKSSVYSAKIDGTGFSIVINNGLMIPEDIAVDYVARNFYFTDSGLKKILVCKMDGSMCHTLHDTNIERPRAIALDPAEGLVYWSDWGNDTAGIYRSGMDGSRRATLVSKDVGWPNGIAVDHTTNRLYWADAQLSTIEYITLDGKIRKVLLKDEVFHPYSLTVFEDNLYWSDWKTFSLEMCNKFTGHKMNAILRENGKHIMGVHAYHPVLATRRILVIIKIPGLNTQIYFTDKHFLSRDWKEMFAGEVHLSVQSGNLVVQNFYLLAYFYSPKLKVLDDEAHFWLNGYVNKQNCRIWSEANPRVYVETPLHPEKLTVWCALWAGGIIGPYFKNDEGHNVTVNGDRYRAMITNFFIPELNNRDAQELWFQQDGATCHTARATIYVLKDTFGDRLISRFGPVNWPPRSCDLTPLDYFLWGYVKSLVYADKPQTLDHLEDNIRRIIADIRPQMLEKVIENWTSRLDYSRGSPMPEILFKM
ncbi:low-density lipoprotein receptor-related protein 4 [Trichonephila clavipes]|nr:low-density lipoprotein receptor-related protein 4 [Trichonephila clavipes]